MQEWRPRKWLAVVLGLLVPPAAFLYVGRWGFAVLALCVGLAGASLEIQLGGPGYFPIVLAVVCAVCAYRIAASATPIAKRPWFGRWYGIAGLLVVLFAVFVMLRVLAIEPFRNPSTSMEPAIPLGATFLVSKLGFGNVSAYGYTLASGPPSKTMKRGSMVVFIEPVHPSRQYVKRLIGLPGDLLEYKYKALTINGVAVARARELLDPARVQVTEEIDGVAYKVILESIRPASDWQVVVPPGKYFVMGDNRDLSDDSRRFGALNGDLLIGEVIHVLR